MEIRVFEWNDSSAEALLAQKEGFQKRFFCVRQIRFCTQIVQQLMATVVGSDELQGQYD